MDQDVKRCECGCGQQVNWNKREKKWNRFIKGHGIHKQDIGFKDGHVPWNKNKRGGTRGSFKKGNTPWNKGLTKETDDRVKVNADHTSTTRKRLFEEGELEHPRGMLGKENKWGRHTEESKQTLSETRKKLYEEGKITSWNKGRTKEDDETLKKTGEKISKTHKRLHAEGKLKPPWRKGEHLPYPVWNKGMIGFLAGKDSPHWKNGASFEPYCPKFNNAFKESIREKFGRVCFLCPTTEEGNGRKLCVHHVNYNKDCLCDDSDCEFVPLCMQCHTKTNNNREHWEQTIMSKLEAIS